MWSLISGICVGADYAPRFIAFALALLSNGFKAARPLAFNFCEQAELQSVIQFSDMSQPIRIALASEAMVQEFRSEPPIQLIQKPLANEVCHGVTGVTRCNSHCNT